MAQIKLVASDIDGTFCNSERTFDEARFLRVLERMEAAGCRFVVASGNQYWQLRDYFPGYDERLAFVAENGAYVKDGPEVVRAQAFGRETVASTLDWIEAHDEVLNVMSCENSAYVARGRMSEEVFEFFRFYYHRLEWVGDLRDVTDPVLKFALGVPLERTFDYYDLIRAELSDVVPTTSGHGAIDLITPGLDKASGLALLAERWGLTPEECAAFGDGENDIAMLKWVGHGYAVENASDEVKAAAGNVCPSNDDSGVLVKLEEWFG